MSTYLNTFDAEQEIADRREDLTNRATALVKMGLVGRDGNDRDKIIATAARMADTLARVFVCTRRFCWQQWKAKEVRNDKSPCCGFPVLRTPF